MTTDEALMAPTMGERIRGCREAKGISLCEMSRRTGIAKSHLSNVERGRKGLGVEAFFEVALRLGVDPVALYWTRPE